MPEMGTSGLMSGDAETGRRECATVPAPVPDSTCGGLEPASSQSKMRISRMTNLMCDADKIKYAAGVQSEAG